MKSVITIVDNMLKEWMSKRPPTYLFLSESMYRRLKKELEVKEPCIPEYKGMTVIMNKYGLKQGRNRAVMTNDR
jgi:hypothetical protein